MFEIKEEIILEVSPRVCDATQNSCSTRQVLQKEPRLLTKRHLLQVNTWSDSTLKGCWEFWGQVQTKLQLEHTRQEDLLHSLFHHRHQLENKNRPNRTAKLRPQLQVTSLLSVWLSVLGLVLRAYSWFLDFPSLHILLHPFNPSGLLAHLCYIPNIAQFALWIHCVHVSAHIFGVYAYGSDVALPQQTWGHYGPEFSPEAKNTVKKKTFLSGNTVRVDDKL